MPRKKKDPTEEQDKVVAKPDKAAKPEKKSLTKGASPKKMGKLDQIRAVIDKAFEEDENGSDFVAINENEFKRSLPHIPSGSIVIDFAIGGKPNRFGVMPCPGFPRGRCTNLYGMEASGKTTLALTLAASTIRQGGVVVYIDWEHAVDVSYAKALGVPTEDKSKFGLVQPATLEKGLGIIYTAAKAGADLIVVDSVGAAVPQSMEEKGIDEMGASGEIGLSARKWSVFLPRLIQVIKRTNSCVVGISQMRDKVQTSGGYGGPTHSVQGGNAWKFYSSLRLMLRRVQNEKALVYNALKNLKEESVVGGIMEVHLEKCKISASQGAKANFYVRYGEGIDDIRSIIEIAAKHGIVKKGGAWYSWERTDGSSLRAQGVEDLKKQIKADAKAWQELHTLTLAKIGTPTAEVAAPPPPEDDDLSEIADLLDDTPVKKPDEGEQAPEKE